MKYRLQFTFTFAPLRYLDAGLYQDFSNLLREHGAPSEFPGLQALQRRHQWAIELPLGAFANDYRPGQVTRDADLAARQAFYDSLPSRPWHTTRDVFERDGIWYYRRPFLERARRLFEHNAIFEAAYRFIVAAEADRTLIKGVKPKKPYVTPAERVARFGQMVRGPGWTAEEDAVLRRWFSVRTIGDDAGRHVRLTKEQWAIVLEDLGGRRTQDAVIQRICYMNLLLRRRFIRESKIVDGYISAAALPEYKQLVLGEQPRIPKLRPPRTRRRKDVPASRDVAKTPDTRWSQELEPRSNVSEV